MWMTKDSQRRHELLHHLGHVFVDGLVVYGGEVEIHVGVVQLLQRQLLCHLCVCVCVCVCV